MNIGVDVSYQFEPVYMSYMANTLIDYFEMDLNVNQHSLEDNKKRYTKKPVDVDLFGVQIKVKLTETEYERIFS